MILTVLVLLIASQIAKGASHRKPHISPLREQVVRRLDRGLASSPMARTGRALEASGWKWHVSPYFIAGIAATESTLGRAACYGNPFNAFGLASCNGSSWVPNFRSWAHAYDFMGRFLSSHWPNARTPYEFYGYAACSSCWGSATAWHMRDLFGVAPETRYAFQAVA